MKKLKKFTIVKAFKGFLPEPSNFQLGEESITPLQANEFLVMAEYISVDPYMRSFAHEKSVPYDQFGFQVGKVIESRNELYPKDTYVVSHSGWRNYVVLNGEIDEMFNMKPYKPDIGKLPLSLTLGALGMPGMTAFLGFLEICKPKKGETVCVTSAAGAVGSIVGQIARKVVDCTVIGIVGSDAKMQILKEELGFQHSINYKTENISERLKSISPNGIDCFFDNVGGELCNTIMQSMKEHGRVAICGSISTYGQERTNRRQPKTPVSVKIESFSFTQWDWSLQSAALRQLKEWLEQGTIKAKETATNGFEGLPDTFVAMLKGDCVGKVIVKV